MILVYTCLSPLRENAGILFPMRCRGAALSCRRGFWEHAAPSSAERNRKEKKCLYFGLLSPSVARLLLLQHERYSRSEEISCFWIYFFTFLTLVPCSTVHDGVTRRMRAGGDYHTCVAVCSGLKPFQVHCGIFNQLILRTIRSEQLCRTHSLISTLTFVQ